MSDDFKGRGESPWGAPPGGGSSGNGSGRRPTPPNVDELIKEIQDKKNAFEKNFGEGTAFDLDYGKLLIIALCIYIAVKVS